MKKILLILISFGVITNIVAQTGANDYTEDLLNLIESKHEYEKKLSLNKGKGVSIDTSKYKANFDKMTKNKKEVLTFINNSIRTDNDKLSKKYVWYNYQSPLSSKVDLKNRISLLAYFKVVKHSLETKKNTLPKLSEILDNKF